MTYKVYNNGTEENGELTEIQDENVFNIDFSKQNTFEIPAYTECAFVFSIPRCTNIIITTSNNTYTIKQIKYNYQNNNFSGDILNPQDNSTSFNGEKTLTFLDIKACGYLIKNNGNSKIIVHFDYK